MNTNPPLLTLHDVCKSYRLGGQAVPVLRDVSLTLAAGEAVALLGPSGSGKTTLLQIAGLLLPPDEGSILLAGQALEKASDALRTQARLKHIGFVYQFHHLLPELSAEENVMMPLLLSGVTRSQAQQRARELLAQVGLEERISHRPGELSGGQCQRVAIARALANKPKLLLADEPTGNLDHETAAQVWQVLRKAIADSGAAALIATHNPEMAAQCARSITL